MKQNGEPQWPKTYHPPFAAPLRNYPIRFGWKLLQLRDLMLQDHSEPPSRRWDCTFGQMAAMLKYLDWTNCWEEAGIRSVCHYLRGSKDLKLEPHIRCLIPQQIWGALKGKALLFGVFGQCFQELRGLWYIPDGFWCFLLIFMIFQDFYVILRPSQIYTPYWAVKPIYIRKKHRILPENITP